MVCVKPRRKIKSCKKEAKIINSFQSNVFIVSKKTKKKIRRRPIPRRLLKWYDFLEIPNPMVPGGPAIATFTLPTPPAAFGPEIPISSSFITLSRIDSDDRAELRATIVWNFSVTIPEAGPEITVISQQMQFSIWRDAPFTGTRLCTVVDTRNLTQISFDAPAGTTMTSTATTSFSCTDSAISGRTHNYYLTGAAGVANGFIVSGDDGGPAPITDFNDPTVTELHFSGSVMDSNMA
ncbi:hypothetical protein [Candidatus Pristimantibacillus sp. PTI5]|uniref:hypothetical protein n=1 Tax=Candidatus Pristimantibacillus sp. PTI5 TaxID=3400422 RepID=UPI003B0288AD